MLHGIHAIFPPTTTTGHCGADPISEGKLEKNKGTWRFEKEVLGWVVDGKNATITLPPNNAQISVCKSKNSLRKRGFH